MEENKISTLAERLQYMLAEQFDYSNRTSRAVISCGDRYVYAFLEEEGRSLEIDIGGNASGMDLSNLCEAVKSRIDMLGILCEIWRTECNDKSCYNDYED